MAQQNLTERSMAVGLRALNRLASSPLIDRLGLRDPAERVLHEASKATVRTATRAGRTFAATQKLAKPARQPRTGRADQFDLTPDRLSAYRVIVLNNANELGKVLDDSQRKAVEAWSRHGGGIEVRPAETYW